MKRLGVIGGTGIYDLKGFKKKEELEVVTPFGRPSAKYILSEFAGKEVVFLPRHGLNHEINPSLINYQANIYGMKKLNVSKILSVSACGSLKEELKPLDLVIPDQFIDRTFMRKNSFFEKGVVAHIALAHPICNKAAKTLQEAVKSAGLQSRFGGVYLNMEGPQFSTKAESNLYRSWGADIIGMTNFSEARLAREAEICYASLSAVTDFDCWHPDFGEVSIEVIIKYLQKNSLNSKKVIKEFVALEDPNESCGCHQALKNAIVTKPEAIPNPAKEKLNILIKKYIK
ncbi:MAG: S-methyl-5'-thioadenosine phosphorylase [Candidatus Omnitrophica bacterium]|nr:S-methyl-5'-thioadenosine phosphorylase [Candidatus Omnitrophota bacterium]MCF7877311.1 S-methyl-5'-thioadenosine phosphorylase [Candidatus Omnitrophota bacterium]MCF7878305.1 S-methyl-5'-thioadenosine phosphorylase [Candidatus Omnitrophota bacterium]MCF7892770.1 S-methyl-5'-thioadenosine phosphorylase [Candidatus Omnitrophota bacterium]